MAQHVGHRGLKEEAVRAGFLEDQGATRYQQALAEWMNRSHSRTWWSTKRSATSDSVPAGQR